MIPRPFLGRCENCGCEWTIERTHGEPNVQTDWCHPETLRGCLCHSVTFSTLVYEGAGSEASRFVDATP